MTFNVVVAYEIFKKVHRQSSSKDEQQLRSMFLVALQNLKYMGFMSATRQGTFSFKKNFFGKPTRDPGQSSQKDDAKESQKMSMILDVLEAVKDGK